MRMFFSAFEFLKIVILLVFEINLSSNILFVKDNRKKQTLENAYDDYHN